MHTTRSLTSLVCSKISLRRILFNLGVILIITFGVNRQCLAASEKNPNPLIGPAVDHPTPPLSTGPAVWLQEYWDVKPDKLDQFVAVYKSEYYSLMRKVPGYRGYLMITTLPRAGEAAKPVRRIHETSYPHGHILLQGHIKTERVINVGAFMYQVHNVLIVHSFRNWADAAKYKEAVAKRYADEHGGGNLWDHLAQTLYPLANNHWEAQFRLALRGTPPQLQPPATGPDADGLDLEPHPVQGNTLAVDVFDVAPSDLSAFLKTYEKNTHGLMSRVPGFRGTSIVTSIPPEAAEARRTKWNSPSLGGANEFYVPQRGMLMEGTIPTGVSINWSFLFKKTFTVVAFYNYTQDPFAATGIPAGPGHILGNGWSAPPGGVAKDIIGQLDPGLDARIEKEFFKYVKNHWDMASYRPIESSLTFDLPPQNNDLQGSLLGRSGW